MALLTTILWLSFLYWSSLLVWTVLQSFPFLLASESLFCTVTNVYVSKWHIHSSWLTRDSLFTVVSDYSVHYSCFSLILFVIFWFSSDDLMWELIGVSSFSVVKVADEHWPLNLLYEAILWLLIKFTILLRGVTGCPSYRGFDIKDSLVIQSGNWKVSVLERCPSYGCPSYRGFEIKDSLAIQSGNWQVSVLERCPSYGMSVLRRFYCIFLVKQQKFKQILTFACFDAHNRQKWML